MPNDLDVKAFDAEKRFRDASTPVEQDQGKITAEPIGEIGPVKPITETASFTVSDAQNGAANQNGSQTMHPRATETTYIDANGKQQTGYLIDGKTYKDGAGAQPVEVGSVVNAGGQQWIKTENGSMLYSDYLKQLQEANEVANQQSASAQQSSTAQQPSSPQGVTVNPNNGFKSGTDSNGNFWTTITEKDGTVVNGYIGPDWKTYYPDGTPINPGAKVVDVTGKIWTAGGDSNNSPMVLDYSDARSAFEQSMNNRYQMQFDDANRTTEYEPTDFTPQINEVYDKAFQSAKAQIQSQLEQGMLDIDQAIAKVPAIYEAGMNDMASQFDMNMRNANEYFAANGLSSGARAQTVLAMNNAYQSSLAAYRLEEANAIQEYEDKRADLKLQAQSQMTEALLQNDVERAQALLAEFQRQDQYNFQFLLQKMEDDYRYYALDIDKEVKRASFNEEQRQYDATTALNLMNFEEGQREFDENYMLNLQKLAEEQRQFDAAASKKSASSYDSSGLSGQTVRSYFGKNVPDWFLDLCADAYSMTDAELKSAILEEQVANRGYDPDIVLSLIKSTNDYDYNAVVSNLANVMYGNVSLYSDEAESMVRDAMKRYGMDDQLYDKLMTDIKADMAEWSRQQNG